MRRYGGTCIALDDDAILDAVSRLARLEGVVVEPSAAAPIAAMTRALRTGAISPSERTVAVATGHGLKEIPAAVLPPMPEPIAPGSRRILDA